MRQGFQLFVEIGWFFGFKDELIISYLLYRPFTIIDGLLEVGYSLLQLSPKEDMEIRSCLTVIEMEEKKKGIEEKELKEKKRKVKTKSKRN